MNDDHYNLEALLAHIDEWRPPSGICACKHHVRRVRHERGQDLPLILGPDLAPLFLPNFFITGFCSGRRRTSNTLFAMAYNLLPFLEGCAQEGFDPVAFALGETVRDGLVIRNLEDRLSAISPITGWRRDRSWTRKLEAYERGETDRAPLMPNREVVVGEVLSHRASVAARYLVWLSGMLMPRTATETDACRPLDSLAEELIEAGGYYVQPPREGVADHTQRALMRAVVPGTDGKPNVDNPFGPAVQFRNFLLVLLLSNHGLRKGEVLGLQFDDVERLEHGAKIWIVPRPDNPQDERVLQPTAKTGLRDVTIPPFVSSVLVEWLDVHRKDASRFGNPANNPFIFLAAVEGADAIEAVCERETGVPEAVALSKGGVDKIFRTLRDKVEELAGAPRDPVLTPHSLRHGVADYIWNIRALGGLHDPFHDLVQNRLMGWSPLSKQAMSYARRAIREFQNDILMKRQKQLLGMAES